MNQNEWAGESAVLIAPAHGVQLLHEVSPQYDQHSHERGSNEEAEQTERLRPAENSE